MARIRSLHPTLFTDEAYASLPMAARVLLTGIWTECDDHGVFEWKPLGLKMKVFPADAFSLDDMNKLMLALSANDCIKEFTMEGKAYGVVRNFCKWQRPKNPTYRYPEKDAAIELLPEWCRSYVGFGSGERENRLPTATEKRPQMKDEGGSSRGKGKTKTTTAKPERESPGNVETMPSASPPGSLSEVSKPILKEVERNLGATIGTPLPEKWTPDDELCEAVRVDYGLTDDDIRTELTAFHAHHAAAGSFSANWRASFQTWCKRWKEHRDKQAPPRVQVSNTTPKRPEQLTADEWANIAGFYSRTGHWQRGAGGEPGQLSCKCPPDILEKHNIDPKTGERKTAPTKVATA